MPDVTIRDVPEPILRGLERKAARNEKDLQTYQLDLLIREAARPTLGAMLNRLDREVHSTLSTNDVLDAIDSGRERA